MASILSRPQYVNKEHHRVYAYIGQQRVQMTHSGRPVDEMTRHIDN